MYLSSSVLTRLSFFLRPFFWPEAADCRAVAEQVTSVCRHNTGEHQRVKYLRKLYSENACRCIQTILSEVISQETSRL